MSIFVFIDEDIKPEKTFHMKYRPRKISDTLMFRTPKISDVSNFGQKLISVHKGPPSRVQKSFLHLNIHRLTISKVDSFIPCSTLFDC